MSSRRRLELITDDERPVSASAEKEFPIDALPDTFRRPVEAIMTFFNIDALLPTMSALGISSTALGAGLQVRSNKAITRANLYIVVGAASGTCKTLVQSALQEPLNEIQNELATRHEREERPKILAEERLLDLQIKQLIKSAKEDQSANIEAELAGVDAKGIYSGRSRSHPHLDHGHHQSSTSIISKTNGFHVREVRLKDNLTGAIHTVSAPCLIELKPKTAESLCADKRSRGRCSRSGPGNCRLYPSFAIAKGVPTKSRSLRLLISD